MSKRTSGLGRGLGDLLADNAPEVGSGATVVWRDEGGEVTVTPDRADAVDISDLGADANTVSEGVEPLAGTARGGEEPTVGEQLSAPLAFSSETPVYGEGDGNTAKNIEKSAESGQAEGECLTNDAPAHSEHHPHRSLKALFKSYK